MQDLRCVLTVREVGALLRLIDESRGIPADSRARHVSRETREELIAKLSGFREAYYGTRDAEAKRTARRRSA